MYKRQEYGRLKAIFVNPSLQMISFTVTEKGYALKGIDGNFLPVVVSDIENGPESAKPVSYTHLTNTLSLALISTPSEFAT